MLPQYFSWKVVNSVLDSSEYLLIYMRFKNVSNFTPHGIKLFKQKNNKEINQFLRLLINLKKSVQLSPILL